MFFPNLDHGLLLFEVPDGGYVEGVEVIRYDEKEKKIYWKIVGTQKILKILEF